MARGPGCGRPAIADRLRKKIKLLGLPHLFFFCLSLPHGPVNFLICSIFWFGLLLSRPAARAMTACCSQTYLSSIQQNSATLGKTLQNSAGAPIVAIGDGKSGSARSQGPHVPRRVCRRANQLGRQNSAKLGKTRHGLRSLQLEMANRSPRDRKVHICHVGCVVGRTNLAGTIRQNSAKLGKTRQGLRSLQLEMANRVP